MKRTQPTHNALGAYDVRRSHGLQATSDVGKSAAHSGRREALYISLAAAEVCWVTPVFLALMGVRNPHSPLLFWLGILILTLGYLYFYRALVAARLALRLQQVLLVIGLVLSIALVLRFHVYAAAGLAESEFLWLPFRQLADVAAVMPSTWVTAMILVYLWARAIHLADRSLSADSVGFSFRAGVVILVAAALLVKLFIKLDISGFVVAYFFFALVAVALARVEEVNRMPNSGQVSFSSFWIGSTVAAVAVLVLLGMIVAALFYGGGLDQVLKWLSPLWIALQAIVVGVATLLMMLLNWVFDLLSIDLSALSQGLREAFKQLGQLLILQPSVPPPVGETSTRPLFLGLLQATITVGIPLAIILLVLLWTWRRLRQGTRRAGVDESRESLLSAQALVDNLQAMLQGGLGRLSELAGLLGRFGPTSRFLAAVSIRRIYANLVRLATEAGYPRGKAQTPYEYLGTLYEALPDSEEEVTVITEAYVKAHYGQLPDSQLALQQIRDCWERVFVRETERRKQGGRNNQESARDA